MPAAYREEMAGIASVTSAVGLTYDRLVLLNIGYDCIARCTSAVVQPALDDPAINVLPAPFHARHFDWDSPELIGMVRELCILTLCIQIAPHPC